MLFMGVQLPLRGAPPAKTKKGKPHDFRAVYPFGFHDWDGSLNHLIFFVNPRQEKEFLPWVELELNQSENAYCTNVK